MIKKMFFLCGGIFLVLVLTYLIMLIDTNSVMKQAENAFRGKISEEEIGAMPINRYNLTQHFPDALVDLKLARLFTLHNFNDGYIWVKYTCLLKGKDGKLLSGSQDIYSKWKIHKENGKWNVVQIFENP